MINKKEETKEIEATEQGHGAKRNYKQPVKFYRYSFSKFSTRV